MKSGSCLIHYLFNKKFLFCETSNMQLVLYISLMYTHCEKCLQNLVSRPVGHFEDSGTRKGGHHTWLDQDKGHRRSVVDTKLKLRSL